MPGAVHRVRLLANRYRVCKRSAARSGFIAPQWGESKNVSFRYRIVISRVEREQQAVRLYLTPQSGANVNEFLAFEYAYTRKR
jgi:hypothetical protein